MINITSGQREKILRILHVTFPTDANFYAFGSRVTGRNREDSDLDVAIDTGTTIPYALLEETRDLFMASDLPFRVDIVDINSISDEFREKISYKEKLS